MAKKLSPAIIGRHTTVDFPNFGIKKVPAKVDTGADSSSIWASQVKEINGQLTFYLFSQGSVFYSGDKITTKDYEILSVRNSFGHSEFRYRVKLPVMIDSKFLMVKFTLADRSQNTYPVLIGRRTLQGRFLVDVSKSHKRRAGKGTRILLLGNNPGDKIANFLTGVEEMLETPKANFAIRSFSQLGYIIEKGKVKVIDSLSGEDIARYDLVYFKSHKQNMPLATALAQYLEYKHVNFFDKEVANHISYDKLTEYTRLAIHGLPVPKTICGSTEFLKANANLITDKYGWPIVCKEISEDRGRKNYLIKNQAELEKVLKTKTKAGDKYVLQQYVPNDGYLRVFVFGSEAPLAIFRRHHPSSDPRKQHLNNPAGSINAELVDKEALESNIRSLAVKAAKIMNRQMAGADIINHAQTGRSYILEVNSSPQLRSGAYVDEKKKAFAKYIDNELNR